MVWKQLHSLAATTPAFIARFGSRKIVRPQAFAQMPWESFEGLSLNADTGAYIALIPYEQYTEMTAEVRPVVYRLREWDEIDPLANVQERRIDPAVPNEHRLAWGVGDRPHDCDTGSALSLEPLAADEDYLRRARHVLTDILNGRYYQLNLLRYFHLHGTRSSLVDLAAQHPAPFLSWFQSPDHQVISFSPERFLRATRGADGRWHARTFPIKGTVGRGSTIDLARSSKDLAELSMIIDLMRNDLGEVAIDGSVRVPGPPKVRDFGYVKHLVGEVSATLPARLTMGALFRKVLPAGSITGAPKREVMRTIAELEERPRNFVMGNVVWFDGARGLLDSSVLIRTVQATGISYEFAAGSGIVVKSTPEHELTEVWAKCDALLQNRGDKWNSSIARST